MRGSVSQPGASFCAFALAALVACRQSPPSGPNKTLSRPLVSGTVMVDGIAAPVRIVRDRWGVPHVYAQTQNDLLFAQGFVQGQDRLFQMDLWRRFFVGLAASAGSNAWAVAPRRTSAGSGLLANDPHRPLDHPSLRYLVHLHAPGWNVIGATSPWLPGVAIGHNDRIAWAVTGDWDRSLATNAPGQSGSPGGPHFSDLATLWTAGRYFPLLFSDGAVQANAESTLTLAPRSK